MQPRKADGVPIEWLSPLTILIRIPDEGGDIEYFRKPGDMIVALNRGHARYLVGWPGKTRQDLFVVTDTKDAIYWIERQLVGLESAGLDV